MSNVRDIRSIAEVLNKRKLWTSAFLQLSAGSGLGSIGIPIWKSGILHICHMRVAEVRKSNFEGHFHNRPWKCRNAKVEQHFLKKFRLLKILWLQTCRYEILKLQSSISLKSYGVLNFFYCGCAYTVHMQVAKQHFLFLSCGYVVAEILPSDCGMAIMDIKKSCTCPPLHFTNYWLCSLRCSRLSPPLPKDELHGCNMRSMALILDPWLL